MKKERHTHLKKVKSGQQKVNSRMKCGEKKKEKRKKKKIFKIIGE